MRVWAVGSLCFTEYDEFVQLISEGTQNLGISEITQLLAGNASMGFGMNARAWALANGIPFEAVHMCRRSDFKLSYGRRLENYRTSRRVDAMVALWDGKSEAVATAILAAHREEMLLYVRTIRQDKILRGVRGRPRNEVRDADRK